MNKKLVLLASAVVLSASTALAQTRVSGQVTDQEGHPLSGATVRVEGTKTMVVTDAQGRFTLQSVPAKAKKLSVSYMGMETQTLSVAPTVKVQLRENALGEVIVVAYGQQKKATFTGSAAVVGSAEIDKVQVTNAVDAMKGKAAGVQINTASGQPGSTPTIRIRGVNSLDAESDPLIVVDGSPYGGDLNSINPIDVESMTVLKDAASTALYGARGGNGVILITTKKAKKGSNAKVTFDAKWGGQSKATPFYETIDSPAAYYEMWYKGLNNYAKTSLGMDANAAWLYANQNLITSSDKGLGYNVYTVPQGQMLVGQNGKLNPNATLGRKLTNNGQEYYLTPDDWEDATFKNSLRQEYTVTATGATEASSFYASANYLDNQGITPGSDYKRFTSRLNADYQVQPWLKAGVNMTYGHYNQNYVSGDGGSGGNMFSMLMLAPIYPIYIRDGQGNIIYDQESHLNRYDYGDGAGYGLTRPYLSQANPLSQRLLETNNSEGNTFNGTGSLNIKLPLGFSFTSINNVYLDEYRTTGTTNPYFGQYATEKGMVSIEHQRAWSYNYQQHLDWQKTFGKHDIQAMLGHEYYRSFGYDLYGEKSKMFSQENTELAGAVVLKSASSSSSDYNTESFFGRVNYNYDEKYFGSANFTRQASSKFHPDNRWGNFWAVGAGWMISKEKWFTAPWVDQLKLKASYGENGNDRIGSYLYSTYYSIINSNDELALSPSSLGNKDITWEKNAKFNVGVDFELFHDRLYGSVEYYSNRTSDMLSWFSLPTSFGFTGYYANVGNMRNNGVELDLHADVISTKDLVWTIYANVTTNHNVVTKLPEERKTVTLDGHQGFKSGSYFYGEGLSMYTRFGEKFAGVDQETGESMWWKTVTDYQMQDVLDQNGQPVLNEDGTHKQEPVKDAEGNAIKVGEHQETTTAYGEATQYLLGDALPDFYGGFGTGLTWKGLDVSVDFQYQIGGLVYDGGYAGLMDLEAGRAMHTDLLKAWTPENKSNTVPRLNFNDSYMAASSDRFLTNASYLSLSNITVGYTLPQKWTRFLKIEKLRLYAVADNVWVWSKRQGLDPRQGITGGNNAEIYRPIRTISGGLTFTF